VAGEELSQHKRCLTSVCFSIAAKHLDPANHSLILGKSGSGKTTLLYALAGVLKPLAGEIRLGDTNILALSGVALDDFRGRNIGIIYQTLHMVAVLGAEVAKKSGLKMGDGQNSLLQRWRYHRRHRHVHLHHQPRPWVVLSGA
jgi:ABC-type lipoprotein export system ATPase subunit